MKLIKKMYKKFAKHVLCDRQLKKYKNVKDTRIKQYFEVERQFQNFEELNYFYEKCPYNLDSKVLTPELVKFFMNSTYLYPRCIMNIFKNIKKYPEIISTSNKHVGCKAIAGSQGIEYYKLLLSQMTGLSQKNIVQRVIQQGSKERQYILHELSTLSDIKPLRMSFRSFSEVHVHVKKILHDIISICKDDFPKLKDIHKKLPRIHIHRTKPGEPRAYYILPGVTCKYTRGNPNQRGKVVVQLDSLHNVDITDLTVVLAHEVIPGHFYEFKKYPYDFYVSPYWFNEGWGLYVEKWCDHFGKSYYRSRLIERLLRSVRCIIDPYIHTKNRSYKECCTKMYELMSGYLSYRECCSEVLRYMCNPGQACSYLIGCKFIEKISKNHKNLYKFHDRLLRIGPAPMKYLKKKLRRIN